MSTWTIQSNIMKIINATNENSRCTKTKPTWKWQKENSIFNI